MASGRNSWALACLTVSIVIASLASSASGQVTLISTINGNGGWLNFGAYAEIVAWSQSSTYSPVSIAAELNGNGSTITGTAYLMTRVGPGTTTANELAHSSFSVTTSMWEPALTTLFTGLTLGPGTYYLVASASGGGWEITNQGATTPVTAPGVSMVENGAQSWVLNSYPPASQFMHYTAGGGPYPYNLEYLVSVVPEPASATLFGLSVISLAALLRPGRKPLRAYCKPGC
jgi:hypothetical protein